MELQSNNFSKVYQLINTIYQFKNIVFFCLYILSRPKLLILIVRNIYLPVYVQYEWLKKFNVGTIVDIGANQGHVTLSLASLCPHADIYAFEPIKNEYNLIKQKTKHLPDVTVVNAALSNKNGKIPFFINRFSPSSSILPLSSLGKIITPSFTKKVIVPAVTLDTYFKNKKLKRPIFIKIDVQGAENIVFEGGKNFLKKTSVIHVETGFETVYKNQSLFGDLYQMLTHFGFIYHGSIKGADFYPLFSIPYSENNLFIKKSMIQLIK